jgi:acyl carrier protein
MALPQKETLAEMVKVAIIEINPGAAFWLKDDQVNLFEVGAMDSVAIVELIVAMEKRLDIAFDYTDLQADFFQTIATIVNLLVTKYG